MLPGLHLLSRIKNDRLVTGGFVDALGEEHGLIGR
jgi:hypothetical protein